MKSEPRALRNLSGLLDFEASLGFPLFTRQTRQISLTDQLALTVRQLLETLQGKVAALQGGDDELVLRISTTHSFALKWLVPRLHRFSARHPQWRSIGVSDRRWL